MEGIRSDCVSVCESPGKVLHGAQLGRGLSNLETACALRLVVLLPWFELRLLVQTLLVVIGGTFVVAKALHFL